MSSHHANSETSDGGGNGSADNSADSAAPSGGGGAIRGKQSRANQAAMILSEPSSYKVCHGCGSILALRVPMCPNCHSYRFDGSETGVVERAILLGKRRRHRSVLASDFE